MATMKEIPPLPMFKEKEEQTSNNLKPEAFYQFMGLPFRQLNIPIAEIDDFKDHPFKVRDDESMDNLKASIEKVGVTQPVIVRPTEDGRYEMISGHRRKRACELLGLPTIQANIMDLDNEKATIIMADTNLNSRETLLPSEKAFAYKMKLDAISRQGQRTDLTLSPVGTKSKRSDEIVAEEAGESRNQIRRYVRLTYLIKPILDLVDENKIALRPAVEISYLQEDEQYMLVDSMSMNDATPSHAQTIKMKKFSQENKLNDEVIESIMMEEKPNQKEKPLFEERISNLIPKNTPTEKQTEFVVKALEYYNKHLQKQRETAR